MRSASCWILILLLCLVAHVSAPPAHAQLPTGEISGTVTDPSGAAVPGAKIDIVNQATSETRTCLLRHRGPISTAPAQRALRAHCVLPRGDTT